MKFDRKRGRKTRCVDHRYPKCETGSTTQTCWRGASKGPWGLRRPLDCSGNPFLLKCPILILTKRVSWRRDSGVVLSLLIQVTVTRFGLGMWQTITILHCSYSYLSNMPEQAALEMVKMLLAAGADVNPRGWVFERSPLFYAAGCEPYSPAGTFPTRRVHEDIVLSLIHI